MRRVKSAEDLLQKEQKELVRGLISWSSCPLSAFPSILPLSTLQLTDQALKVRSLRILEERAKSGLTQILFLQLLALNT